MPTIREMSMLELLKKFHFCASPHIALSCCSLGDECDEPSADFNTRDRRIERLPPRTWTYCLVGNLEK
jgi:hypothetical protein